MTVFNQAEGRYLVIGEEKQQVLAFFYTLHFSRLYNSASRRLSACWRLPRTSWDNDLRSEIYLKVTLTCQFIWSCIHPKRQGSLERRRWRWLCQCARATRKCKSERVGKPILANQFLYYGLAIILKSSMTDLIQDRTNGEGDLWGSTRSWKSQNKNNRLCSTSTVLIASCIEQICAPYL